MDGQISVILRGFIFAVDSFYLKNLFFPLCLNEQKKLKDLDMKVVCIFPQFIYSKYYACTFQVFALAYDQSSLLSSLKRSEVLEVLFSQKVM